MNIHAKDLPFENAKAKETLIENLAQSTSGMSGADLAAIMSKTDTEMWNREGGKFVTQEDINNAKMDVIAGLKTDYELSDYEKHQIIAREAGHALSSVILEKIFEGEEYKHKKPSKVLDFISNTPRGGELGATYFKPSSDNKSLSKETCFADVIMLYARYAVETEMFDTHTSNVQKDIREAAEIIEKAVTEYDFGSSKRYVSVNSSNMRYLFG